jgi:hypothetical protein
MSNVLIDSGVNGMIACVFICWFELAGASPSKSNPLISMKNLPANQEELRCNPIVYTTKQSSLIIIIIES